MEEKDTGEIESVLLGGGRYRGYSTALILCSYFRGCCLDLVDGGTGGKDGLHEYALEQRHNIFRLRCSGDLDLVDIGTGGTKLVLLGGVRGNSTPSVQCLGRRVGCRSN